MVQYQFILICRTEWLYAYIEVLLMLEARMPWKSLWEAVAELFKRRSREASARRALKEAMESASIEELKRAS